MASFFGAAMIERESSFAKLNADYLIEKSGGGAKKVPDAWGEFRQRVETLRWRPNRRRGMGWGDGAA